MLESDSISSFILTFLNCVFILFDKRIKYDKVQIAESAAEIFQSDY